MPGVAVWPDELRSIADPVGGADFGAVPLLAKPLMLKLATLAAAAPAIAAPPSAMIDRRFIGFVTASCGISCAGRPPPDCNATRSSQPGPTAVFSTSAKPWLTAGSAHVIQMRSN